MVELVYTSDLKSLALSRDSGFNSQRGEDPLMPRCSCTIVHKKTDEESDILTDLGT